MKRIRGRDSNSSVNRRRIVVTGDSRFDALPEECISQIISHTSPLDACVVSSVSKTFKSAADSDLVWEKFLPAEYWAALVPRSMNYSSKKEIYLSLVDDSVLIDNGKKSIWLEKSSKKKCFMLSAMDLTIVGGDSPDCWEWISDPESKFEKVAKLLNVCWFEIRGKISSRMLSENTHYSVYVVYERTFTYSYGFYPEPVEARVGFVGKEATKKSVILDPWEPWLSRRRNWKRIRRVEGEDEARNIDVPKFKEDRWWMEAELGKFYIPKNGGDCEDDEIEISIMETKMGHRKEGLIFRGIEIRPDEFISEQGEDDGPKSPRRRSTRARRPNPRFAT